MLKTFFLIAMLGSLPNDVNNVISNIYKNNKILKEVKNCDSAVNL